MKIRFATDAELVLVKEYSDSEYEIWEWANLPGLIEVAGPDRRLHSFHSSNKEDWDWDTREAWVNFPEDVKRDVLEFMRQNWTSGDPGLED